MNGNPSNIRARLFGAGDVHLKLHLGTPEARQKRDYARRWTTAAAGRAWPSQRRLRGTAEQ